MYYDFLVKIPENTGRISKNKRKDVTYIEYTYGRKYIPEKKYNVAQRTTIGKMDPSNPTMMYPNPNFEKYFPDIVLPDPGKDASRSSCIRVGAFLVIKKIIDDYKLLDHLSNWDERGRGLLLDLAAYSIICENNAAQYYPDYAYNHLILTPKHKIYSDSTISRFLSQSQYHQLCWWFGFALPGRIAFPPEGGLTNHSFSYWWPLKSGSFLLF